MQPDSRRSTRQRGGRRKLASPPPHRLFALEAPPPNNKLDRVCRGFLISQLWRGFRVSPKLPAYGRFLYELGGRVALDRVPANWQLTNTTDEEDYPAAATGPNGETWLAYIQFRHDPKHDKLRAEIWKRLLPAIVGDRRYRY
jgi:hypothetical protein